MNTQHCTYCGYCLSGLDAPRCPECGNVSDSRELSQNFPITWSRHFAISIPIFILQIMIILVYWIGTSASIIIPHDQSSYSWNDILGRIRAQPTAIAAVLDIPPNFIYLAASALLSVALLVARRRFRMMLITLTMLLPLLHSVTSPTACFIYFTAPLYLIFTLPWSIFGMTGELWSEGWAATAGIGAWILVGYCLLFVELYSRRRLPHWR